MSAETKPAETKPAEETTLIGKPKADEAKPTEVVVPLALTDLAFPEGLDKDDILSQEFIDLMNKPLSPKERANELLKLQSKALNTASEKGSQGFADLQKQWKNEIQNDPVVGGAKLDANLANIYKSLEMYGTPLAREEFETTGSGNAPGIFRYLAKMTEALQKAGQLGEPTPVQGSPGSAGRSLEEILYPNQGKAT